MTANLAKKLKIALDESRLLILGAQVIFGLQFESAFQQNYSLLSEKSKALHLAAVCSMALCMGLLIYPSLYYQIAKQGQSSRGSLRTATISTGAAILPLLIGLSLSSFVMVTHAFGIPAGVGVSAALFAIGVCLLYGAGWIMKKPRVRTKLPDSEHTPLSQKIEQMLTEARVLIPGAQALLGFQFIATLTNVFDELPSSVRLVHLAALCAIALSVILLMTPAAVHRLAFDGENDARFYAFGSRIVVIAALPMAVGVASDIGVVFYRGTGSDGVSVAAGAVSMFLLLLFWFVTPWLIRLAVNPKATPQRGVAAPARRCAKHAAIIVVASVHLRALWVDPSH